MSSLVALTLSTVVPLCPPAFGETVGNGVGPEANALYVELFDAQLFAGEVVAAVVGYERLFSPEIGVNVTGIWIPGGLIDDDSFGLAGLSLAQRVAVFGSHSMLLLAGTGLLVESDNGWIVMSHGLCYEYRQGLLVRLGFTPHLLVSGWKKDSPLAGLGPGVIALPLWGGGAIGVEF